MNTKSVAIVMATYNGELFIQKQLMSILDQSFDNFNIYISDDGSTDKTIEIIKDIAASDDRVHFLGVNCNPGVVRNFNRAFCETSEDIVFVSDQDDIWPDDRLDKMLTYYYENVIDHDVASLIYTDMILVDKNGDVIAKSFYQELNIDPIYNTKLNYLTWRCTSYGCTMMVNRALLNKALPLPEDEFVTMHDNWLILCAANLGNVHFMNYGSVNYRQHESNHTGGMKRTLFQKLKNFSKQLRKIHEAREKREKQSSELIRRNLASEQFIQHARLKNKFIFFKRNIFPYKREKKIYSIVYFISMFYR